MPSDRVKWLGIQEEEVSPYDIEGKKSYAIELLSLLKYAKTYAEAEAEQKN